MWSVVYLPEARAEREALGARERVALDNAVEKLQSIGPALPFPHSSAVRTAEYLRELRSRGGRSSTRALYRRIRETFVIAAIGPDGKADPGGFALACERALDRLVKVEDD
jgi:hypothetical protein